MDGDLYDEFGNYVGPDLDSEEEEEDQHEEEPDFEVNNRFTL
jgi:U5 small nuclear ribonucleoprotein component